jgi:hypothetical protein
MTQHDPCKLAVFQVCSRLLRERIGYRSAGKSRSCYVLKNTCRVEALQLDSIAQLERALALFMVVTWRIAHLMRLGRTFTDLDAHLFFDPDEIQAAYLLRDKVPLAKPRMNDVLRQIACLGGFLAR